MEKKFKRLCADVEPWPDERHIHRSDLGGRMRILAVGPLMSSGPSCSDPRAGVE